MACAGPYRIFGDRPRARCRRAFRGRTGRGVRLRLSLGGRRRGDAFRTAEPPSENAGQPLRRTAGLWDAAHATRHDAAARLAVVPMVLEARGLDVTPLMIERLRAAGDEAGTRILERILDDEIRHVRFGSKHFFALSARRGESPEALWKALVKRHFRGTVKPPFNDSARLSAGLSRSFYAAIAL